MKCCSLPAFRVTQNKHLYKHHIIPLTDSPFALHSLLSHSFLITLTYSSPSFLITLTYSSPSFLITLTYSSPSFLITLTYSSPSFIHHTHLLITFLYSSSRPLFFQFVLFRQMAPDDITRAGSPDFIKNGSVEGLQAWSLSVASYLHFIALPLQPSQSRDNSFRNDPLPHCLLWWADAGLRCVYHGLKKQNTGEMNLEETTITTN
ncbi:hypothetical protein BDP27DRAFT_834473 [Rhodocollybia butyracea]|uniref:Uncharacterized protein n=1 Tax=Rhodocollybia butyracea TaxID=206335 RepID=A0A9P5U5X1_9AGAR|nr:hypothetical protein BDP27DRAFT_834473 [Rhodocollybia butyracea]